MEWRKAGKKLIYTLLPPAFWLGAWQLCAFLVDCHVQGRGNDLLLPYPAAVLAALVRLAGTSAFWGTVAATLGRILAGMVLGTALGGLLAALTFLSPWSDRLLSPAIRVIRAIRIFRFFQAFRFIRGHLVHPVHPVHPDHATGCYMA